MLTVADTAFAIATIRAAEGELPEAERLFVDPYASIFSAAGAHAREGTERFLGLPFFRDAIRLRTRFIDDFVRDGIAATGRRSRRVVLLGAGFDMRALRLPEIAAAGALVYEVDLGELLARKRALLETAGVTVPAWVEAIGCDFRAGDLEEALRPHDLSGAIFVWEGVVAYLDDDAIDRTLALVARSGGQGSRLVFDSAASHFEATEARARRAGFSRVEHVSLHEAWRRYLPGEPHENAQLAGLYVLTVS